MKKIINHILNYRFHFILWIVVASAQSGCSKLVDVEGPGTSLPDKDVFRYDNTAIGAVTTLYSSLSAAYPQYGGELSTLSVFAGLSADELVLYSGSGSMELHAFYKNELNSTVVESDDYWGTVYKNMYRVNAALQGINASGELTPAVKNQLLGELRFMRAFYYFYLVNLYGDVPLILGTNYEENTKARKTPRQVVYQQIIDDLKEAQSLLNEKYLSADLVTAYTTGNEERVRPTKWAATALLARVYLYTGDWTNAETQSTIVLNNVNQFELVALDGAFLKNNKEAIWQLQPVNNGFNAMEGYIFVLPSDGPNWEQSFFLNDVLLQSFDAADQRKAKWISSVEAYGETWNYSNKYKVNTFMAPVSEYSTVFRLAEQYLIRAEARAQLNNLDGAIDDIDMIRDRAELPLISSVNPGIDKAGLLAAVLTEKQHEFFTEWGHRWLDLKRTGKVDEVMEQVLPLKRAGGVWESSMQWYPISLTELRNNPNL